MSVDWASVAAEVSEAIKSIGPTDEGFTGTLRQREVSVDDFAPPSTNFTYATVAILDGNRIMRDASGSVLFTQRTFTIGTESGAIPGKGDQIAVNVTAQGVTEWLEIDEVRTLSPGGVTVLYEIDLAR